MAINLAFLVSFPRSRTISFVVRCILKYFPKSLLDYALKRRTIGKIRRIMEIGFSPPSHWIQDWLHGLCMVWTKQRQRPRRRKTKSWKKTSRRDDIETRFERPRFLDNIYRVEICFVSVSPRPFTVTCFVWKLLRFRRVIYVT